MPIFEYKCRKCSFEFEALVRNAQALPEEGCPECGSKELQKLLSTFAAKLVAFGSVAMAGLYPFFVKAFANSGLQLAMAVFVTLFVIVAHRHNYRRVQEGKEEKFFFGEYLKKKKAEDNNDDE